MSWPVERLAGSAADLHHRPIPEPLGRAVWRLDADDRAIVLGSAQRDDVVDHARAADAGVAVVRRRSGGGAVWVEAGRCLWVDVLLPRDDPLWDDDVGQAARWVGDTWAAALADQGIDGVVHTGGFVRSAWSDLVCFAGTGPGEVLVEGRKLVGLSQRRTRVGARFQCVVHDVWDPAPLLDVLALDDSARRHATGELGAVATGLSPLGGTLDGLAEGFFAHLPAPMC